MSDFMDALVRALRDHQQAIDTLTARITQLEKDADPRTAEGAALDRWARIVGADPRDQGEDDEALRARIEGFTRPMSEHYEQRTISYNHVTFTPATELPPGTLALAIGTRVRIDDKTSAWHEDEGKIVRVPGPGDAPEVYDVALPGGVVTIHRAHLALVDDTLPECTACRGAGSIPLFSGVAECDACGGSGVTS